MAKFGLHLCDLEQAGCFPRLGEPAELVRFRDAQGHTRYGCGDPPDRLQRALNAGQSIAHFQIDQITPGSSQKSVTSWMWATAEFGQKRPMCG
ncbi:hypothetical protein [Cupriavidus agavae]|uniref:hypothetical protein n=1 Tax=Cupriavidus agavae TaxID=1001822 RepID=UPI0018E4FE44|nr:hypothetical protein [Cupriavidus agavae]